MLMSAIEKAIEIISQQVEALENDLPHLKTNEYINAFEIDIANKKLAISALKEKAERTPATVISSEDDFYHFCSECNNEVYKKDKYCHTCGRELKWGIKA